MAPNRSKKHPVASEKSFLGPGNANGHDAQSHAYPPQQMHPQSHAASNSYNPNNLRQHGSGPTPILAPSPAGFGPSGPGPGPGNADVQPVSHTYFTISSRFTVHREAQSSPLVRPLKLLRIIRAPRFYGRPAEVCLCVSPPWQTPWPWFWGALVSRLWSSSQLSCHGCRLIHVRNPAPDLPPRAPFGPKWERPFQKLWTLGPSNAIPSPTHGPSIHPINRLGSSASSTTSLLAQ